MNIMLMLKIITQSNQIGKIEISYKYEIKFSNLCLRKILNYIILFVSTSINFKSY